MKKILVVGLVLTMLLVATPIVSRAQDGGTCDLRCQLVQLIDLLRQRIFELIQSQSGPTGQGGTLVRNATTTLTWNPASLESQEKVSIKLMPLYSSPAHSAYFIRSEVENSGSYVWKVGRGPQNNEIPDGRYRLSICGLGTQQTNCANDGEEMEITTSDLRINVTQPTTGSQAARIVRGHEVYIRWATSTPSDPALAMPSFLRVNLALRKVGNVDIYPIIGNTENDGVYAWQNAGRSSDGRQIPAGEYFLIACVATRGTGFICDNNTRVTIEGDIPGENYGKPDVTLNQNSVTITAGRYPAHVKHANGTNCLGPKTGNTCATGSVGTGLQAGESCTISYAATAGKSCAITMLFKNTNTTYFTPSTKVYFNDQGVPSLVESSTASLTLTAPVLPTTFTRGATVNFTWNKVGTTSPVNIFLRDKENTTVTHSIAKLKDGSSFSWIVPASLPLGEYYVVISTQGLIKNSGKAEVVAGSSNSASLTLTAPALPVTVAPGSVVNFSWSVVGTTSPINLFLRNKEVSTKTHSIVKLKEIEEGTSYSWTVPTTLDAGEYYVVLSTQGLVQRVNSGTITVSSATSRTMTDQMANLLNIRKLLETLVGK